MYIDNENFEKWMEKLSKKLTEIGQDLKSLINTDTVFDENEKLLDNQDLAFLLKASFRTLQRYRAKGVLPYFTIGRKTYYKASDTRAFVHEYADSQLHQGNLAASGSVHPRRKSSLALLQRNRLRGRCRAEGADDHQGRQSHRSV